uniref:Retrotransposon gag domain-containing protein n=1 Tax=Ananas comosus var. bracteatus TaxID=296719 RepID=A0A6V7QKK2_ANACO|nr:unnamed protein product [Ananas comosus var. bracteatus]
MLIPTSLVAVLEEYHPELYTTGCSCVVITGIAIASYTRKISMYTAGLLACQRKPVEYSAHSVRAAGATSDYSSGRTCHRCTPPATVPTVPVAPPGEASPHFDGSRTKPWVVESWVSAMEKLFEDLFIPKREQVHLADEFCKMLYGAYFPNSVKQKLEKNLKKLQQGEQSVQKYTL